MAPLLSLIAGIVLATGGWQCAAFGIIALIGSVLLVVPQSRKLQYGACALFCGIGVLSARMALPEPLPHALNGQKVVVTAKVASADMCTDYVSAQLTDAVIEAKDTTIRAERLSARLYLADNTLWPGDQIRVSGKIRLSPSVNDYFFAEGINATMNCYDTPVVIGYTPTFAQRVGNIGREAIVSSIEDAGFDKGTQGFLLAILAGNRSRMDAGVVTEFRSLGIAHVLSLSGLHVAVLVSLFFMCMAPVMLLRGGRTVTFVLAAVLLCVYALSVGGMPSVVRASLMCMLVMLSWWLCRPTSTVNLLCVTLIIILTYKPLWLWSTSLQLSVLAVMGILILYVPVYQKLDAHSPLNIAVTQPLLITVAATLVTAPVCLLCFGDLPLWFLPANIVAALLVPPIICVGTLATILGAIGLPNVWLTALTDFLVSVLENFAGAFA